MKKTKKQSKHQSKKQSKHQSKKQSKHQSKKQSKHQSKKQSKHQKSFLKTFLLKKSNKINTLFNSKDIINMLHYFQEDDNTFTKDTNRCMCIDYDVIGNDTSMENNQDYRRCKSKVKSGTDYCEKHQDCISFISQNKNGFEIEYNPGEWSHPYVKGTHNCYSYFLNDIQKSIKNKCDKLCKKEFGDDCPKKTKKCGNLKPQPGHHHLLIKDGNLNNKKRDYKCSSLEKKIKQDNPSIINSNLLDKCPKQHYKGAMVVDDDHTFHFYRMNKDSSWSHKPGTNKVINYDADKKQIYIPHIANRDYSNKPNKIKYNSFCNYYCIPTNNNIQTNSI